MFLVLIVHISIVAVLLVENDKILILPKIFPLEGAEMFPLEGTEIQ